ncbi:hypothetical protein H2203_000771 [Taxawa tesnikishii (nom. ined.)]|nr:hypothetical protein H2203_000771 [Dothideales sp. JES 119]
MCGKYRGRRDCLLRAALSYVVDVAFKTADGVRIHSRRASTKLNPSALGGIDLLSFTTTPRFQGIKNLPKGFHFVFTGSTASYSVRHGAWFYVSSNTSISGPPELFIKKWDASKEELIAEADAAEILRWRANLGQIWRESLTPYRQTASKDGEDVQQDKNDWVQLTDCISEPLLTRILGSTPGHWALTSASCAERDMDDIPGLNSAATSRILAEKELGFLPVDLKQTWRAGATGRERTDAAQDRSWALGELAANCCAGGDWMEVLGELEFCFLMVLTLNNYSCLEQWKRVLELMFTCKAAVNERPQFYNRAVATLKMQLQHCQDVEGGLEQLPGNAKQDVMDEVEDLQDYLKETYGWQIEGGKFARTGMLELEDGEQVEMDVTAYDEDDEEGDTIAPKKVPPKMTGGAIQQQVVEEDDDDDGEEEETMDLDEMDERY